MNYRPDSYYKHSWILGLKMEGRSMNWLIHKRYNSVHSSHPRTCKNLRDCSPVLRLIALTAREELYWASEPQSGLPQSGPPQPALHEHCALVPQTPKFVHPVFRQSKHTGHVVALTGCCRFQRERLSIWFASKTWENNKKLSSFPIIFSQRNWRLGWRAPLFKKGGE